jgi:hypothetical protein
MSPRPDRLQVAWLPPDQIRLEAARIPHESNQGLLQQFFFSLKGFIQPNRLADCKSTIVPECAFYVGYYLGRVKKWQ